MMVLERAGRRSVWTLPSQPLRGVGNIPILRLKMHTPNTSGGGLHTVESYWGSRLDLTTSSCLLEDSGKSPDQSLRIPRGVIWCMRPDL